MTRSNVQLGGQELKLDADGDTSIQVSTDDVLVIDMAGSEKLRIDSDGDIIIGKTAQNNTAAGTVLQNDGFASFVRDGDLSLILNRLTDTGTIIDFRKDGSTVGSIAGTIGLIIGHVDTGLGFQTSTGDAIIPQRVDNQSGRDDAIDLGNGSFRFDDIFATNTSITTSDQNEKQDIASITTKELNVAKKLSALFKTFRWKSKVTEKGDKARTHTGIIAQEVQSAFNEEGLDASKYGLFTSDTWWYKETEIDAVKADEEKGIEAKDAYTKLETFYSESDAPSDAIKKTRLGVRYPELFSFIFSSIEARLTALESK